MYNCAKFGCVRSYPQLPYRPLIRALIMHMLYTKGKRSVQMCKARNSKNNKPDDEKGSSKNEVQEDTPTFSDYEVTRIETLCCPSTDEDAVMDTNE